MKRIIAAILIIVILITSVDLPAFADSEHPIEYPGYETTGYEYEWDYLIEYGNFSSLLSQFSFNLDRATNMNYCDRVLIQAIKDLAVSTNGRTVASYQDANAVLADFDYLRRYQMHLCFMYRDYYQGKLCPASYALYDMMFGTTTYYQYEGTDDASNIFNEFSIPDKSGLAEVLYLFNISANAGGITVGTDENFIQRYQRLKDYYNNYLGSITTDSEFVDYLYHQGRFSDNLNEDPADDIFTMAANAIVQSYDFTKSEVPYVVQPCYNFAEAKSFMMDKFSNRNIYAKFVSDLEALSEDHSMIWAYFPTQNNAFDVYGPQMNGTGQGPWNDAEKIYSVPGNYAVPGVPSSAEHYNRWNAEHLDAYILFGLKSDIQPVAYWVEGANNYGGTYNVNYFRPANQTLQPTTWYSSLGFCDSDWITYNSTDESFFDTNIDFKSAYFNADDNKVYEAVNIIMPAEPNWTSWGYGNNYNTISTYTPTRAPGYYMFHTLMYKNVLTHIDTSTKSLFNRIPITENGAYIVFDSFQAFKDYSLGNALYFINSKRPSGDKTYKVSELQNLEQVNNYKYDIINNYIVDNPGLSADDLQKFIDYLDEYLSDLDEDMDKIIDVLSELDGINIIQKYSKKNYSMLKKIKELLEDIKKSLNSFKDNVKANWLELQLKFDALLAKDFGGSGGSGPDVDIDLGGNDSDDPTEDGVTILELLGCFLVFSALMSLIAASLGFAYDMYLWVVSIFAIPATSSLFDPDMVYAIQLIKGEVSDGVSGGNLSFFNIPNMNITLWDFMFILFQLGYIGGIVLLIRGLINRIKVPEK